MLTDMCDLVPDPRLILQKHPFKFISIYGYFNLNFNPIYFCPITFFSSEILLLPTVVNQMN